MKVTVLGIDGLDYNIVEELNLVNLKQAVYGKLSIPDECYRVLARGGRSPWTPLCWLSILTGDVPPKKYQMTRNIQFDNQLLESLRWRLGGMLRFVKGKRKILWKLGFKPSRATTALKQEPISKDIGCFFDLVEKGVDFNVPTYSDNYKLKPPKKLMSWKDLLPYVEEEDQLMKRYVTSIIGSGADYDLFMAYTRLLDHYGHQMYRTEQFYYRYRMMDLFVRDVSKMIVGLLLIVSDHGIRSLPSTTTGGEHSDHAFYSMNVPLDVPMNSLTDVYNAVKKALQT